MNSFKNLKDSLPNISHKNKIKFSSGNSLTYRSIPRVALVSPVKESFRYLNIKVVFPTPPFPATRTEIIGTSLPIYFLALSNDSFLINLSVLKCFFVH